MPCSNCFRSQRPCVIAPGSKRCRECVNRKIPCDGVDFASALFRSVEDLRILREKRRELQESVLSAQQALLSTMQQEESTQRRADELFRRGTMIVDAELEASLSSKATPAPESFSPAAASQQAGSAFDSGFPPIPDADWVSFDFDSVGPGSVGGTAGASPGSSNVRGVPMS